jgi:hypothetical protein
MNTIVQRSYFVCSKAQKCSPMTHLTVTCMQLTCCGGYVIIQERTGFKMIVYTFNDTIHDRVRVALTKEKIVQYRLRCFGHSMVEIPTLSDIRAS